MKRAKKSSPARQELFVEQPGAEEDRAAKNEWLALHRAFHPSSDSVDSEDDSDRKAKKARPDQERTTNASTTLTLMPNYPITSQDGQSFVDTDVLSLSRTVEKMNLNLQEELDNQAWAVHKLEEDVVAAREDIHSQANTVHQLEEDVAAGKMELDSQATAVKKVDTALRRALDGMSYEINKPRTIRAAVQAMITNTTDSVKAHMKAELNKKVTALQDDVNEQLGKMKNKLTALPKVPKAPKGGVNSNVNASDRDMNRRFALLEAKVNNLTRDFEAAEEENRTMKARINQLERSLRDQDSDMEDGGAPIR